MAGDFAGRRNGRVPLFPRYLQLLPVVVLLAARGFAEMRGAAAGAGATPADSLGASPPTSVAARDGAGGYGDGPGQPFRGGDVRAAAKPGDTLFVWGTGRKSTYSHCRRRRAFWIPSR